MCLRAFPESGSVVSAKQNPLNTTQYLIDTVISSHLSAQETQSHRKAPNVSVGKGGQWDKAAQTSLNLQGFCLEQWFPALGRQAFLQLPETLGTTVSGKSFWEFQSKSIWLAQQWEPWLKSILPPLK